MHMTSRVRGVLLAGSLFVAGVATTQAFGTHEAETHRVSLSDPAVTLERVAVAESVESSGAPSAAPTVADTLSTLDGVFTEEQAQAGKQVYDLECALCHGPTEFAGRVFQITWTGQPLSSLYRHISLTMPLDNPGGLDTEKYVAVLAYILELNGYPAGERELPDTTDDLNEIVMERLPDADGRNEAR